MYFVKSLCAVLILFYAYSAIALPCKSVFESANGLRKSTVNGNKLRADTLNGVANKNALPEAETKLEVQQEKDTETAEYFRDLVSREWDLIWDSIFPRDQLIAIHDVPQLTREQQINMMYRIVEIPEYSIFDVRERVKWLKVLFANGVDVNTQNGSGDSLLHVAAGRRGITGRYLVRFLLKNEADIHLENHLGKTSLEVAYERDNQEVAQVLQNQVQ